MAITQLRTLLSGLHKQIDLLQSKGTPALAAPPHEQTEIAKVRAAYTAQSGEVVELKRQLHQLEYEMITKNNEVRSLKGRVENLISGKESAGLPPLREGTERTPGRSRRDDSPEYHDAWKSFSSHRDPRGDVHDHERLADNELAKKLLSKLQDLVGPRFGYHDSDMYHRIAAIIAHEIGRGDRFALMHFMNPEIFDADDGEIFPDDVVQNYVWQYLKGIDKESSRKSNVDKPTTKTPRVDNPGHTLVPDVHAKTPDGIVVPAKKPEGLVADLSPAISNLLINLKMMHDDM